MNLSKFLKQLRTSESVAIYRSSERREGECRHSLRKFRSVRAELKLLQTLIYQECGMFFDERRSQFLQDRLQRRLKACQMDSFYSYYLLLTSAQGKKELSALLENLTVNETSFFRIRPQLDLFKKKVLEELLRRKQERRDWSLRVWSAGCSTGQEPYTLAILICDTLAYYYLRNPLPFEMPTPKPLIPPPWKVEILASDINYSALLTAQQGIYTERKWKAWTTRCGCDISTSSR